MSHLCNPMVECGSHVLCQRCGLCVGHCTCPPEELRGDDEKIKALKAKQSKRKSPKPRKEKSQCQTLSQP